jgi:hypothetical protein
MGFLASLGVSQICNGPGSVLTVVNWRLEHARVLSARLDGSYAFETAVGTDDVSFNRSGKAILNFDQCAFAGAILTAKAVDFASP